MPLERVAELERTAPAGQPRRIRNQIVAGFEMFARLFEPDRIQLPPDARAAVAAEQPVQILRRNADEGGQILNAEFALIIVDHEKAFNCLIINRKI